MRTTLLGIAAALWVAGCATAGSLDDTRAKAPDRVVSDAFNHSFDRVYAAARLSCLDLDLAIEKEDRQRGRIYAKSSPNMAKVVVYKTGFGEHVGVYVTKIDDQKTKVEVVTQKSNRLEVGYKDYRRIILKLIRPRLEGLA